MPVARTNRRTRAIPRIAPVPVAMRAAVVPAVRMRAALVLCRERSRTNHKRHCKQKAGEGNQYRIPAVLRIQDVFYRGSENLRPG
jgi:hypothetical protein